MKTATGVLAWLSVPTLLLAGAAPAQGQEARYRFVTSSSTEGAFVDDPSLARDGDTRSLWTLWVFMTPTRGPDGTVISHRRVQYRVRCTAGTTEATRHIAYDAGDRVLVDYRPDLGPQSSEPGTTNNHLVTYACTGQLPDGEEALRRVTQETAIRVIRGAAQANED